MQFQCTPTQAMSELARPKSFHLFFSVNSFRKSQIKSAAKHFMWNWRRYYEFSCFHQLFLRYFKMCIKKTVDANMMCLELIHFTKLSKKRSLCTKKNNLVTTDGIKPFWRRVRFCKETVLTSLCFKACIWVLEGTTNLKTQKKHTILILLLFGRNLLDL